MDRINIILAIDVLTAVVPSQTLATESKLVALGPGWRLEQAGQTLRLIEQGRYAAAIIGRTRRTPWHMIIDARGANGRGVTLTITFATCPVNSHRGGRLLRLSWEGRNLDGCYIRSLPSEKPLLD